MTVLIWLVPAENEAPPLPIVSSSGIKALAVLPLDNLSAEPNQEYFTAGMTEALIAELSQIGAEDVPKRERKPVNPDVYDAYLKAKIMYLESNNKPEQAIQAAEKVIELDPEHPDARFAMARVHYRFCVTE